MVDDLYATYLNRAGEEARRRGWLGLLQTGMLSDGGAALGFLASGELFSRAWRAAP